MNMRSPKEAFELTSGLDSRRRILIIPRSILLKVAHSTSDPLTGNHITIDGRLMPSVTPVPTSRSLNSHFVAQHHVNCDTIAVLETIERKKVVNQGIAAIFLFTFDTNVDMEGDSILGRNVFLAISTWSVGALHIKIKSWPCNARKNRLFTEKAAEEKAMQAAAQQQE